MKIEVLVKNQHLKIYIDGILHLSLPIENILGIKSYVTNKHCYNIDYHTQYGVIDSNYVQINMWKKILKGLDKLNLCHG